MKSIQISTAWSQCLHNSHVEIYSLVVHGRLNGLSINYTQKKIEILTSELQARCLTTLTNFYNRFVNALERVGSWEELIYVLEKGRDFRYFDKILNFIEGIDFLGPCPDERISSIIKEEVLQLAHEISDILCYNIQRQILDIDNQFYFEDSRVVSNNEIIKILFRTIDSLNTVQKIKWLWEFKIYLHSNIPAWSYSNLSVEANCCTVQRDVIGLYDSVNKIILSHASLLTAKDQKQIACINNKGIFLSDYFYFWLKAFILSKTEGLSAEFKECDHYQRLEEEQRKECLESVRNHYERFQSYLTISYRWEDLLELIDTNSRFAYFDGYNVIGSSSDTLVNITIDTFMSPFNIEIKHELMRIKQTELIESKSIDHENIILLTNEDLINIIPKILRGKGVSKKIEILVAMRNYLQKSQCSKYYYDFSNEYGITKGNRNINFLKQWIENAIAKTAAINLKNRAQRENLKIFFLNQIDYGKIVVDDLEVLLNGFRIENQKSQDTIAFVWSIHLGNRGKAKEIIHDLFSKLQELDAKNSVVSIQIWIYVAFLSFDGKGFSLSNIQEITD